MNPDIVGLLYLAAGVLFILALRGLSNPESSRLGNMFGMAGMVIAVVTTLAAHPPAGFFAWVLVGLGLALGGAIGAVTFTGSVIAFLKLDGRMSGKPILLPLRHLINIAIAVLLVLCVVWFVRRESHAAFWILALLSFLLGVLIIVPIGGADMPVVISMLNSYSGWAAAGIGFTLGNTALIITGALVGSSGAILSYIMCRGMNRSFISVILGGFGGEVEGPAAGKEQRPVKHGSADDAAFIMKDASKVIVVPGYGMAVAQAQHALRAMADHLKKDGVEVK